uniref:Uncharacterized protein n=1 Tax=Arundo donax TaxID=35708 RepID=A0A0A9D4E6_ARUDO
MLAHACRLLAYITQLVGSLHPPPSTGQTPCQKPAMPPSSPLGQPPHPRRRAACSSLGRGIDPCSSDPSSLLHSLHPGYNFT